MVLKSREKSDCGHLAVVKIQISLCNLPSLCLFIEHLLWEGRCVGSTGAANVNMLVLFSLDFVLIQTQPPFLLLLLLPRSGTEYLTMDSTLQYFLPTQVQPV